MKLRAIAVVLLLTSTAFGQDVKHPDDKCPDGYHTSEREKQIGHNGEAKGGASIGVFEAGLGYGHQRSQTERYKVCTPNERHNLSETPNSKRN